jgi:TRAP-type mannitol/chloroaromatic compound transport system permease large subunit
MVQAAFKVMGNDVLISIPLFVFMGYLVERANLIEKLFRSLHLAWRACRARWRWPRCSPARCSPRPPASSVRWSR